MARHHTFEQLEFLKESYKKDELRDHGGHTLDLMNPAVLKRFANIELKEFEEKYREEWKEVERGIAAQKNCFAEALVDAEKFRRVAKVGSTTASRPSTSQARLPSASMRSLPRAKTPSSSSKRLDILNDYNEVKSELHRVMEELQGHGIDRRRALTSHGSRIKKKASSSKRRRNHSSRNPGKGNSRLRERSELEKRAQRISNVEAHRFHIQHQYTTHVAGNYGFPEGKYYIEEPSIKKNKRKETIMTLYANALAKAPDLRGKF